MDTGVNDKAAVTRVRQINELPTINKNMIIFNGTYRSTLEVNPWKASIRLNNVTNGMQFSPGDADKTLKYYDNRLLRILKFKHTDEDKFGPKDKNQFKVLKFEQDDNIK